MPALSREQVLQANDLERECVEVPEWGGALWIVRMDEDRRGRFDDWNAAEDEAKKITASLFRARLIADCAADEAGQFLFTPDDVAALMHKSPTVIRRLSRIALRINRMRASDLEELEKNSEGGPAADSP